LSKKKTVRQPKSQPRITETREKKSGTFHIEFLNSEQKNAWKTFEENDIIFCLGAAGSGKTFLSTAYACQAILTKSKKKITLTRPIIESQESLGYLPGSFSEKVASTTVLRFHLSHIKEVGRIKTLFAFLTKPKMLLTWD